MTDRWDMARARAHARWYRRCAPVGRAIDNEVGDASTCKRCGFRVCACVVVCARHGLRLSPSFYREVVERWEGRIHCLACRVDDAAAGVGR